MWLETVPRRSWRFIGRVTTGDGGTWLLEPAGTPGAPETADPSPFVGRDAALAVLAGWLGHARRGSRQTSFVTGEAGIGKTRLLTGFLARDARALAVRAATELARLLVRDDRCVEARAVLAPLLASWVERRDTVDLRDAAAALRDAE